MPGIYLVVRLGALGIVGLVLVHTVVELVCLVLVFVGEGAK